MRYGHQSTGPASPKLLGERRGEQGVAQGVPPLGIFRADLCARFPDHLLHRFQSSNARRASYFGAESPGGAFGRTAGATLPCGGDTEGSPWRERPRDLTAPAIMPAATAEVAHATRLQDVIAAAAEKRLRHKTVRS